MKVMKKMAAMKAMKEEEEGEEGGGCPRCGGGCYRRCCGSSRASEEGPRRAVVRGGQWEAEGGLPRRPRDQRDRGLRHVALAAWSVRYACPLLVGLLSRRRDTGRFAAVCLCLCLCLPRCRTIFQQ